MRVEEANKTIILRDFHFSKKENKVSLIMA